MKIERWPFWNDLGSSLICLANGQVLAVQALRGVDECLEAMRHGSVTSITDDIDQAGIGIYLLQLINRFAVQQAVGAFIAYDAFAQPARLVPMI